MTDGISVSLRVSLARATVIPPVEPVLRLVRVLHELELPAAKRITPPSRPEVRQMFPVHFVPFTRAWQLKSFAMNQPWLTADKWTAVYTDDRFVTNDQGYGIETDPRANFVKGTNLTEELPRVECLTCGGNLLHVIGETRVKTSSVIEDCYIVETIDYTSPPPATLPRWLTTVAVTMDSNGIPRRFPQGRQADGYMADVLHPLLADPKRYTVVIPKWRVELWNSETCDPYRLYKPV
jgi:hypothetical protein